MLLGTLAALPEGRRITDYISLGVITKTFSLKRVRAVLALGKIGQAPVWRVG